MRHTERLESTLLVHIEHSLPCPDYPTQCIVYTTVLHYTQERELFFIKYLPHIIMEHLILWLVFVTLQGQIMKGDCVRSLVILLFVSGKHILHLHWRNYTWSGKKRFYEKCDTITKKNQTTIFLTKILST